MCFHSDEDTLKHRPWHFAPPPRPGPTRVSLCLSLSLSVSTQQSSSYLLPNTCLMEFAFLRSREEFVSFHLICGLRVNGKPI